MFSFGMHCVGAGVGLSVGAAVGSSVGESVGESVGAGRESGSTPHPGLQGTWYVALTVPPWRSQLPSDKAR